MSKNRLDRPGKDGFGSRHQVLVANAFSRQCAGKGHELVLVNPVQGKENLLKLAREKGLVTEC